MVNIVGNVKPEDDYTHPLGPEENFNESVYFNFFDRAHNRGGFIRVGNRRSEQVIYIGEGMTEYTLDGDRVGYGLSEYLDQPGDEV